MKRIISLLLSLIIILTTYPVAFALNSGESKITSPGNSEWLDPYEQIKIEWDRPTSNATNYITIKNDVSGAYIVQDLPVIGNYYILKSNTLDFEERYKICVKTYTSGGFLGNGDYIFINVNDRLSSRKIYESANFTYPENNQTLSPNTDLKISISSHSDLACSLVVKDETAGKNIINEENLTQSTYTISKTKLSPGHRYKAWLGTYKKASVERKFLDSGKTLYFSVAEAETKSYNIAKIVSPTNDSEISTENDLEIKWNSMDSELAYYLKVTNINTGEIIKTYKTQESSSCKIDNSLLKNSHQYKAELTTYIPDPGDWTDKKLNGEIIGADTCTFTAVAPVYAKITKFNAEQIDESIVVSYEISEGEFYSLRLTINDSDGGEYMTNSNITKRSGTLKFTSPSGIDADTYTIIAEMYRQKGYITDEAICTITYTNATAEKSKPPVTKVEYEAAEIYEPSSNKYFDLNETIKIRWDEPAPEAEYVISIRDESSGDYALKNHKTANTYYTITTDTLLPDKRYKVSVKTTINGEPVGNESYIYIHTNAKKEDIIYEAAEIYTPSNNTGFDTQENIKVKWNQPFAQSKYRISVRDENTGKYIVEKLQTSDTYYTINGSKLLEGHQYKILLETYSNENKVGNESIVYINVNDLKPPQNEGYVDVPENHINYDSIMFLSQEGVLSGYGNDYFKPEANITRAEFVKIICKAFNLGLAGVYKNFNDTSTHWAREHIEIASSLGLVNGVDEYNFAPDDNITYQHAAKVITILKGLDSRVDIYGGYPTGYLKSAVHNELFNKTDVIYNGGLQADSFYDKNASRCDIAQIVYNALNHDGIDMTPIDLDYINSQNHTFAATLETTANNHIGNTYDYYGYGSNVSWCVYSALCIVRESLESYGCSDEEINEIIPYASYSEGSTGKMIFIYNNKGRYHSYTSWVNKNRKNSNGEYISGKGDFSININTSGLDYIPAPGDFIAVETANDGGIPDHLGLVISVDRINKKFVSIEGNTGLGTTSTRKVRWVDYEYSTNSKKWVRTSQYGGSEYYVHGFLSPNYPS